MPFGEYLKSLRALRDVRPEDLALAAGLHVSTVYKAEKGDQVRWETVKQLYAGLCKTDDQRSELMIRWEMSLDPSFTKSSSALSMMSALLEEAEQERSADASEISRVLASLSHADRDLLKQWCLLFAASEPTRGMTRAWLDALSRSGI
jgi:hypothetical protein